MKIQKNSISKHFENNARVYVFGFIILVFVLVASISIKNHITCWQYAELPMKDVPAKCIAIFQPAPVYQTR